MDLQAIDQAVKVLKEGGVVAHPTDTCYGLAVDIFNPKALARLYEVKEMPSDKPVSILTSYHDDAFAYAEFSDLAHFLTARFWPGPLTLVLPRRSALPEFLNPGHRFVGIRFIDEPISVTLLKAWGKPVTTTSANRHGLPNPYCVSEISAPADIVLNGGELDQYRQSSTLVQVDGDQATILRRGAQVELYEEAIRMFETSR